MTTDTLARAGAVRGATHAKDDIIPLPGALTPETFGQALRDLGADPVHPLRISSLTELAKCSGLYVIRRFAMDEREANSAADTGTAVGYAIEMWHTRTEFADIDAVLGEVRAVKPELFPLADDEDFTELATAYTKDPRNPRQGLTVPLSFEFEVDVVLPPWPTDPTRKPIHLRGHIDQLRWDKPAQAFRVWDVKCGGRDIPKYAAGDAGLRLLHEHAWQLSLYTIGMAEWLRKNWPDFCKRLAESMGIDLAQFAVPAEPFPVLPGGIIWPRGYGKKGKSAPESGEAPVFFEALWTAQDCHTIIDSARYLIARLRAGEVPFTPGAHCAYCVGGPHICPTVLP